VSSDKETVVDVDKGVIYTEGTVCRMASEKVRSYWIVQAPLKRELDGHVAGTLFYLRYNGVYVRNPEHADQFQIIPTRHRLDKRFDQYFDLDRALTIKRFEVTKFYDAPAEDMMAI